MKVAQFDYLCLFNLCSMWKVNLLRLCCDSLINDPEAVNTVTFFFPQLFLFVFCIIFSC